MDDGSDEKDAVDFVKLGNSLRGKWCVDRYGSGKLIQQIRVTYSLMGCRFDDITSE
jgi:hypothetical protein